MITKHLAMSIFQKSNVIHRLNLVMQHISNTSISLSHHPTNVKFKELSLESRYAREYLEGSKSYAHSISKSLKLKEDLDISCAEKVLEESWENMSNEKILENFEILSHYVVRDNKKILDERYAKKVQLLKQRCSHFTDSQLFHLLKCLELWDPNNQKIFKSFLVVVDNDCLTRLPKWNIDKVMLANDHFIKLELAKFSVFTKKTLTTLNIKNMTPANLVQYAFFLKVNKKLPIKLHAYESLLEKYVDKLTVDELGIISMAFFKYETGINRNLLTKIIQKFICNIENVNDVQLSSVLKILRYSIDLKTVRPYELLLHALVSQVPKRTIACVTHIAHIQASILLDNTQLILKIIEKYETEIRQARLKDIERMLYNLFTFNYNPKEISLYSTAANELLNPDRINEINQYPKSFVYAVMFMLQANFYSEEVLKRVMEPKFISIVCKDNIDNLSREYLSLDYCLEIEHSEYNGPRIEASLLKFLVKKLGSLSQTFADNTDRSTMFTKDFLGYCKAFFGSESAVHNDCALPHYSKSDIFICYDPKTNEYLEPGKVLSQIPSGTIKYAPVDGKIWYAIVLGTSNLLTRNYYRPTGILAMKIRQLRRIGYTVCMIPYYEWRNQVSQNSKKRYLENILVR